MKVLIVHPSKGFYGGAEEVVVQLANYLVDNGHEYLLVTKNAPEEVWKELGANILVPSRSFWNMRSATRRCLEWADVVNVHNFPATLAAFPTKKPIVYMCNEPAELFTNWWRKPMEAFNRRWVKRSNMRVVVADEMNAFRFYKIYGVEPTVIPYGVDHKFWSNHIREANRGDRYGVLQVGTITPYKNQEASIRAVASLKNKVPSLELGLAGSTDADRGYYEKMEDLAGKLDVRGRVNFTGQIDREQIRGWYYKADVLVHPVREQGGWLVPFEAICAGLPVVTSPSFTASSIIEKNKLGIVTSDLISGIKQIIEGKGTDTEKAKEWVKKNLTWEKFGESMVKIFEGVLSERN